jgi:hypothetical protein
MLAKTKIGGFAQPIAAPGRLSVMAISLLVAGINTTLWTGIIAALRWAL